MDYIFKLYIMITPGTVTVSKSATYSDIIELTVGGISDDLK